MSVVNKMLQDLEARQSKTDELNADYQPPQKNQSKLWLLVLLILFIAAVTIALIFKNPLFSESKNTEVTATVNTPPLPFVVAKKMIMAPQKTQPQVASAHHSKDNLKKVNAAINTTQLNKVLTDEKTSQNANELAADNIPRLQNIDTQGAQLKIQNSLELDKNLETEKNIEPDKSIELEKSIEQNSQTASEQISSFTMSGNSQKNSTRNLKQRIAQSLNNDNFDLAQSLLNQLLANEPNNIKARKKSASLLFAKGNYAQSKQLLIQGIELHPAQSDLRLMLARLYVVQKEPLKAMTLLTEVQPSTDNSIEYLAYRAVLAQQLKQTTLAKSDYQALTNIEYSNAKWWLGLAITRDQLGEINEALHAYNKAHSLGQLDGSVNKFIQQRISVLAGAQ
jgi:MSHA biogenesis protein MshN